MTEPITILPRKLSDLLELSVRDCRIVEQNPRYAFNMQVWHMPGEICEVCMSGGVLANTLHLDPASDNATDVLFYSKDELEEFSQEELDELDPRVLQNYDQLSAIDFLRCGYVDEALEALGESVPDEFPVEVDMAASDVGNMAVGSKRQRADWEQYDALVIALREAGL